MRTSAHFISKGGEQCRKNLILEIFKRHRPNAILYKHFSRTTHTHLIFKWTESWGWLRVLPHALLLAWPTCVFLSFRHIHNPNQRPWCAWVCAVKELAPTIDDASQNPNKYKYLNTTRDLFPQFQVMALNDHDKQQEVENTHAIATLCFFYQFK